MPDIKDYLREGSIRVAAYRDRRYYLLVDDRAEEQDAPAVLVDLKNNVAWPPARLQSLVKFNGNWKEVRKKNPALLKKLLAVPWQPSSVAGVEYAWEQADQLFLERK